MKKNMGSKEKMIRLAIAAVIAGLYFGGVITGTLGLVLLIVGIVLAATSLINFCPMWAIVGINTSKNKDA